MLEHDAAISEYEHEKFRPREAEALQTLRKVASLAKPIMRQRGWRVGVLTEFWPPEKNLLGLNWNKGQKICLRLRYPYDERQFLPLEEVVDTMLHELCHIVHGPHDEAFHGLWNQLRSEHEQLIRKGYTGEGFLSTGHKLGGGRIPMLEARRRARVAAEKRRTLTAGSGQKLGGAPIRRGEDIRKVIVDAATRRATVTKGCASGTDKSREIVEETTRNGFRTKAEEDDANEEAIMQAYIDLIQEEERDYVPPSSTNPAGNQGRSYPNPPSSKVPSIPQDTKPNTKQQSSIIDLIDDANLQTNSLPCLVIDSWTCEICTLSNPSNYLCCDACGTERASSSFLPSPQTRALAPMPTPAAASKPAVRQSSHLPSLNQPISDRRPSKAIKSLSTLSAAESKKPLGWLCQCGTFMESQWWTCASCGSMKLKS